MQTRFDDIKQNLNFQSGFSDVLLLYHIVLCVVIVRESSHKSLNIWEQVLAVYILKRFRLCEQDELKATQKISVSASNANRLELKKQTLFDKLNKCFVFVGSKLYKISKKKKEVSFKFQLLSE